MRKHLHLLISILIISCNSFENHYHDGKYYTKIEVFGVDFSEVNYELIGNELIINNSVTGISKLKCNQFEDRIEYIEQDGTIRVLPVLKNGNIKLNDNIILRKIDVESNNDSKKSIDISNKEIVNNTTKSQEATLGIPFIGEKHFETRPGISGTGTPNRFIKINENGDVYFRFEQKNQADGTITEERYYAGKFQKNIKCYFKKWGNEIRYYKVTKNNIYEVDKNGNQLQGEECCGLKDNTTDSECNCESNYF